MRAIHFAYPAKLEPDEDGEYIVSFRDLPEALTSGHDEREALAEAADCLDEAIAGRINRGDDIPQPSPPRKGEQRVAVPAHTAAQAALYLAMRATGISKSELARRLGCDVREARRLLDPRHPSKIERLEAALAALGGVLEVGYRKMA